MNKPLLHKAFNALFSRGIGLLLQLGLTVILGRLLGAAGMGVFSLYTSWMMMFASIANMGMPNFVLRKVSVLDNKQERGLAISFTTSVIKRLLVSGGLLTIFVLAIAVFIDSPAGDSSSGEVDMQWVLILSVLSAVAFMIIKVLAEALKGIRQVNLGLAAETALVPLGALLVLGVLYAYDWDISSQGYLVLHLVLLSLTTLFMFRLLLRFRHQIKKAQSSELPRLTDRSLLSFWGIGLLNMWFMNMPIILLPQFATAEEIGIYGVAFRLIALASIILVTLASLFGPKFARDFANNDAEALKQGLKQSQLLSMLIFIPMLLVFTLFAEPMLGIFGEEFKAGKEILWILIVGQTLNAATGLVGFMMNMIHKEKQEFYIHLATTLMLMVMIFILGNEYGVIGVALAYALVIVIKNLTSLIFSLYHLNSMQRLAGAVQ